VLALAVFRLSGLAHQSLLSNAPVVIFLLIAAISVVVARRREEMAGRSRSPFRRLTTSRLAGSHQPAVQAAAQPPIRRDFLGCSKARQVG